MFSPDQDHPSENHIRLPRLKIGMNRRRPTALFWSDINSDGALRLGMDKRLGLAPLAEPRARTP